MCTSRYDFFSLFNLITTFPEVNSFILVLTFIQVKSHIEGPQSFSMLNDIPLYKYNILFIQQAIHW